MTAASRPRRQRKADRLTAGAVTSEEIMCDYALAPFDALATQMDQKWGIDRLPELVSTETAAKYGSAMAKLNSAIEKADPAETATRAEVCRRGLLALDAEAVARGNTPPDIDGWQMEIEGRKCVLIRETRDWQLAEKQFPGCTVYTLREAIVALRAAADTVAAVKAAFPGADIVEVRRRSDLADELNDDIPW